MRHTPGRRSTLTALALLLLCGVMPVALADPERPPERLTIEAGRQQITVWSRQPEHPLAAVVLIHGRTWSARPDFDFRPRSGGRSLLQALVAAGFAAYAVDLPGYGSSPRDPSGWLSPRRAAECVEAVLLSIAQRHPDLPSPVLLGWSRGSKISALVATRARQPLSALLLYAYNLDLTAPPDNGPATGTAPALRNTTDSARSDFVSPAVTSPLLIRDFVHAALAADPIRADVCCDVEFRDIRPESIRVPTLMIYGARDPAFKAAVAGAFFTRLAAPERRWVIVAGGDHAVHLEDTAPEFVAAVINFIHAALGQARKQ
jgi:alpha-beta hydrolase superfamily lysophospholipase